MILLEIQNVSDLMWFRIKENQCPCTNATEGLTSMKAAEFSDHILSLRSKVLLFPSSRWNLAGF